MTKAAEAADKIMALVDEFPSEPFSFERQRITERLTDLIAQHTYEYEGEIDEAFELGRDTGSNEMAEQMRSDIEDLENEIQALREENDKTYQEGYDNGFDAGIAAGN